MSDVVHERALFTRAEGSGWQEYTGQLMETGELRLVGKDGATVHSITMSKGSEIDGPQPNKDATKFILFLKAGKSFLEVSASSLEAANEWITELKAFSSSKGFLGIKGKKEDRSRSKSNASPSALSSVGNAASSAAGAVGGLAAKVWRKSTKAMVGKEKEGDEETSEPKEKPEKAEKQETPTKLKTEGSVPSLISVSQKSSAKKGHHRRSSSGLNRSGGSRDSKDSKDSEDDSSSAPLVTASNEGSRNSLVANIPVHPGIPTPITRVKLNLAPPTYKGFKFEKVDDVSDQSDSSDEEREEDFKILSARFRKHEGIEESESSSSAPTKRRRPRSGSVDKSEDSDDEERKPAEQKPETPKSTKKSESKKEERKENKDIEQRRSRIVNEVLSTEQTYVKNIGATIQFYYDPLLAKAAEIGEDQDKINRIFGNLRTIHQFNSNFMGEIQKCVQDWKTDSMFGPIFLKMAPFLKMYTAYSNKYEEGINTFNTMLKKNEKFAALIKEQQAASGLTNGLFDLLIQPIQRVPRYSLLLKDLINHTSESHPDLPNLRSAITIIEEIGQHINEEVRRAENQRRVEEMSQKGVNLATLIAPHRFLLKEGLLRLEVAPSPAHLLSKTDAKPKFDNYQFFLFNDVFIHVKKSEVKADLDLTSAQFCCPLSLIWLTIDSGRKVFMKQPWEHISFGDEGGWHAALSEAVKNWCQLENDNDRNPGKHEDNVRYGTFDYPNNSGIYKGAFVDGKREGKGTLVTFGSSYRGEFKADKFDGKGRFDYFNGDYYLGGWSDGLMHGKGRLVRADGSTFIGEWQRGVRKGYGKQTYSNGDFIEAKWKNDRVVGEGRMICSNGMSYQGEMKDNRFEGVGVLTLRSGSVYHGEFKEGLKHGKGVLTYPDGHQYVGEFREDLRHGQGTFSHKDRGVIYEGAWDTDRYHGQGTRTYASGQYTGSWVNGERVGKGSCTYADGGVYLGLWEDDKPHGEGIYADKTGYCYQGTWVKGKREPKGQCWFKNGGFYIGHFLNGFFTGKGGRYYGGTDELIASYDGEWNVGRMHGKGAITFRNGDSYKGVFHYGSLHGEGEYTFANGTTLSGEFTFQQLNGGFTAVLNDKTTLTGQVVGNVLHRVGATAFNLPASTPFLSVPYYDIDLVRILEQ